MASCERVLGGAGAHPFVGCEAVPVASVEHLLGCSCHRIRLASGVSLYQVETRVSGSKCNTPVSRRKLLPTRLIIANVMNITTIDSAKHLRKTPQTTSCGDG